MLERVMRKDAARASAPVSQRVEAGFKPSTLHSKQHAQALAYINDDVSRHLRFEHRSSSLPIEILHVISENNARDLRARRERHLERVALCMTRNRTGYGEARFRIVGSR